MPRSRKFSPVTVRKVAPVAPLSASEIRSRVVAFDNRAVRSVRAEDYPTETYPVAPDEITARVAAIVASVEGEAR